MCVWSAGSAMMDNDEMVEDLECRITETKEDIQVIIYLIVRVGGGGV